MRNILPITPKEAAQRAVDDIPDLVVEAFNEAIIENLKGNSAAFTQDYVIDKITKKLDISRELIFERRYLDAEALYEAAGWKVEYDKPGFNESYKANFKFTRK